MTLGNMENVEVFDTEGKGRGLRAAKELCAGEVVFAEPSFAAVVFDSLSAQVCHSCFRRQEKLHRCGQCRFAQYCDRTCQRACWEEHKQECAAIKNYGKAPNENIRLAARILWRIGKDGGLVSDGQLTTLDELEDHMADMPEEDLKELKIDVHNFLDYWPRGSRQYNVDCISHIFGVINCNGFTLIILNHGNQTALNSVYHSQRRIELRALGKIAKGEELTVGYVDFLNVSTDRQRLLKQQYFFDCTCEHCTNHSKDDLMMATKEVDGKEPSESVVKEVTEYSLKALEKIEKARTEGNYHEVVKLCREALEKQDPVLADTHLLHLRILSVASEVLSYLQFFKEAAGYAHRMVEGYKKLYHANNAQLGMATMRSGVTHWHAGLIEDGHSMICKAYAILMITHGPSHAITKDLEAMRMQTEMELRMFKQNEYVYHTMREAALKNQPVSMMTQPIEDGIKEMFRKK
ncbi:hypothetical protein AGOR_G00007690 [Albula goreensis]|uniref:[histone H3]-lysine(4) N-trimethyltransferase n=1 Tax=Albula goreensis TaxID=1534307 RepID=A0A8T3E5S8_9TELE|nr:hypothetical protein AGOR_G00007690 [Albula goreensis]